MQAQPVNAPVQGFRSSVDLATQLFPHPDLSEATSQKPNVQKKTEALYSGMAANMASYMAKHDVQVMAKYDLQPIINPQQFALDFRAAIASLSAGAGGLAGFTTCTYNMSSTSADYKLLCQGLDPSFKLASKEEDDAFNDNYVETQKATAALLSDKAKAFCLQEVGSEDRSLITSLKDKGFQIIHAQTAPYKFDNAIALDTKRFKNITNHSMVVRIAKDLIKDVAIATATDKETGQKVTFVSAHVPGSDFSLKPADVEAGAAEGDLLCQAIVKKISRIGKGSLQIIGADMNVNPEKWEKRFQIFRQSGFQLHRTNTCTNVNSMSGIVKSDKFREIDFIFTRTVSTIWQKIKSIFVSTVKENQFVTRHDNVTWLNSKNNASDHMPVFMDVTSEVIPSKICRLWKAFCRLVTSCCGKK